MREPSPGLSADTSTFRNMGLLGGARATQAPYARWEAQRTFDELGRPAWLFAQTVHQHCPRAGYYEEGTFAKEFGDKECLVEVGCWGPVVNCNIVERGAEGAYRIREAQMERTARLIMSGQLFLSATRIAELRQVATI